MTGLVTISRLIGNDLVCSRLTGKPEVLGVSLTSCLPTTRQQSSHPTAARLRKISLLRSRQINERRNYTVHVRGTGATWFSVAVPSWSTSFIVVSRDSSRAVFSIKTLTARFLPNTAIVPCRRMVMSLSTSPSVFEFAAVTTPKSRGCQGVRFSILMLPNRGLGFNGTKGLLINLYLMPLWVLCLGNLNRHWVNRQSLLDFLVKWPRRKRHAGCFPRP